MSVRVHPLDGALLLFDPRTGRSIHARGPATASLRRKAPRVVQFAITNRCNLACGFCHRDTAAESAWTVDDAFVLLRDLDRAGVLEVAFGGGEPFAFKDFPTLLRRLRDETRLAVSITTNGLLLDGGVLDAIAGTFAELRVSLYDERSLAALERLRGLRFGVNWLVTPSRLPALEATVLDLAARGARDVLLLSYNGDDDALHLGAAETRELSRRVARLAIALRGRTSIGTSVCFGDRLDPLPHVLPFEGCDAGRDFVAIGSDRTLSPCSFHPTKIPIRSADDVLAAFARRGELSTPAHVRGCARLVPLRARATDPRTHVRIFEAFASNNSGTYALVGSMPSEESARALADALRAACVEQDAWRAEGTGPSPLERLAKSFGLDVGEGPRPDGDDWPDGGPPDVLAVGNQLLVHVDWTVTMPRIFGQLVYANGGRVSVEHDHAHHAIVAVLSLWIDGMWQRDKEEIAARLDALEKELREEVLPKVLAPRHDHERVPEPAWLPSYGRSFAAVFPDLVTGIAAANACADRHGAKLWFQLVEAPLDSGDPLLAWRASTPGAGAWQVVLWCIGDDRVAAMKAMREAASLGLDEVKAKLQDLPTIVLDQVDEATAKEAHRVLVEAGCRADAFIPRR